ncbi:metallophosphoesterase [Candidatus Daviesbacteria bacterium]|nr:metallophosphoesterase [Candidatus Daviesbacteria bacterium]
MFRKHSGRKSANPIFILFRFILSLIIFTILLGGVYSAYKHFSGLDPLKLDPKSVANEALTLLSKVKIGDQKLLPQNLTASTPVPKTSPKSVFKFLLVADSHSDNNNLQKAISQAKQIFPDIQFVIGLGDYTEVGTLDEMQKAKKEFDEANLRYFLIPGDHDLWDSRDKNQPPLTNFRQIFGPTYQSFSLHNFKFILLDNSDNYLGIDEVQLKWVAGELERSKDEQVKAIFVFVHEPLFHPSSDHIMGRVEKELKNQARSLIFALVGVKKVFAGDTHYFSQYNEPETNLSMVTIGAVGTERNPQLPRFAVVTVFEDGSTMVDDVEIK